MVQIIPRFDEKEGRNMMDTPLLVNIKGCGYPPEVDCSAFAIKYMVGGGSSFLHKKNW